MIPNRNHLRLSDSVVLAACLALALLIGSGLGVIRAKLFLGEMPACQILDESADLAPEDAEQLEAAGVAAVYTPKDFELNRIMSDLVRIVESRAGGG